MKAQIYAIFDTCSGIYEKPFFHTADDAVKREFQDVVNTADHPINRHPEHYSVWRLGNFDNLTGDVKDEANECLWTGLEAMSQPTQSEQSDAISTQLSTNSQRSDTPLDVQS